MAVHGSGWSAHSSAVAQKERETKAGGKGLLMLHEVTIGTSSATLCGTWRQTMSELAARSQIVLAVSDRRQQVTCTTQIPGVRVLVRCDMHCELTGSRPKQCMS